MLPDPNDRPVSRKHRRGLRGLTVAIAITALAVFVGLIGYTYMLGAGDRGDGPVPLIKADTRPMKTAPDRPGGMEVPHQDKEIYNRMGRDAADRPVTPRVERLLPPPETPIDRPRPATAPPPLEPEIPPSPVVMPPPGAVEVTRPTEPPPAPVAQAPAPAPTPAPPRPSAAAPTPQPPQAAPAPVPTPPPAQQTAAARPPAQAATGGRYRIQLAALRTPEDASREWERLRRAHPDLLGSLNLNVVRADLAGRGTFYRIQAGPLGDDSAAKELCRRLAEKKVGCLVVRP